MNTAAITAWPGKLDKENSSLRLPAAWHMLDVGACAALLMQRHDYLKGLSEGHRQALLFLVVLHDLGKFSASFRNMLTKGKTQSYIHWKLSAQLLNDLDPDLAICLGGLSAVRNNLYAAVAGHHGGPPEPGEETLKRRAIGAEAIKAARAFIAAISDLFPGASLEGLREKDAKKLSWLLSGLTVQSDWLGSNTRWFPIDRSYTCFTTAWEDIRNRAKRALSEAGLAIVPPAPFEGGMALCGLSALRPMQAAVEQLHLPDGPMLTLIEDATGAGKTEAALILAQRMINAGKANGLFFALPPMATANAIFERVGPIVQKMFKAPPSFVLANSRKGLNTAFQTIVGQKVSCSDTLTCSQWLADDRRLSLLAEVGVGTIDQLLMAVLPIRFNTLRLWGLSGKVVIVDEAHSYDPYMERELATFLRFHAMLGGSAIVMTATLPKDMRNHFAKAFQSGLGVPERRAKPVKGMAYPALSVITHEVTAQAIPPVPETCRRVRVERLADAQNAVALLQEASHKGAACLWVRNAVDDAIAAVEILHAAGVKADLLHARFTMWDRLRIEETIQARFGRNGQGREGRVLVATQVIEASLDLDFDVMVSDLAPIGSLIQRSGRLWRHMSQRPAAKRPVAGPALHVLSPDPEQVDDDRWLHQVLKGGAWVYKQDEQWRTAKVLFNVGEIDAPGGLRPLIKAVHGEEKIEIPDPLKPASYEAEGIAISERAQAGNNVLEASGSFAQPNNMRMFDDEDFPTRLGEPQVTLLLTRAQGDGLTPWAKADSAAQALALSEVQISKRRYNKLPSPPDQTLPEVVAFKQDWPKWKQERVVVAIMDKSGKICEGLQYDTTTGVVIT
jgi:CRISPR-associated endonuclease/helicase Cas3